MMVSCYKKNKCFLFILGLLKRLRKIFLQLNIFYTYWVVYVRKFSTHMLSVFWASYAYAEHT